MQSKPVLIFLVVLLLVSTWSLIRFSRKMAETEKNRNIALKKVSELREAKLKLEADIGKLGSERGVEEVLREDYGLVKEGEGMIIVVEDQSLGVEGKKERGGFFSLFRNLFR